MSKELAKTGPSRSASVFQANTFADMKEMAAILCTSQLLPEEYRGKQNLANVMVAMDIANRIGQPPLTVMENLDNIKGRRSFSSKFLIAQARAKGYRVKYEMKAEGAKEVRFKDKYNDQKHKINDVSCRATMITPDGEELTGPKVSIEMAVKEGWYSKTGSKWQTMPELMLRYRAASFLIKTELPEMAMGMAITEDLIDGEVETVDAEYEEVQNIVDNVEVDRPDTEPDQDPEEAEVVTDETPDPEPEPDQEQEQPDPEPDQDDDDDYDIV